MFSGCRVSGMEGGTLLLHMAQEKNRRKPVRSPGYHQFPLPPAVSYTQIPTRGFVMSVSLL